MIYLEKHSHWTPRSVGDADARTRTIDYRAQVGVLREGSKNGFPDHRERLLIRPVISEAQEEPELHCGGG